MLRMPSTGCGYSVEKHNGSLEIQADWVESSALFESAPVSRSDILDALMENNVYIDQDFAYEWISVIFSELSRRFQLLGNNGCLHLAGDTVERDRAWEARSPYAFCLALSMLPHYRKEVELVVDEGYVEQGSLFERLCLESLRCSDWEVEGVGWSNTETDSFEDKVAALAGAIGESVLPGAIERWTVSSAKDAGLDLVLWQKYADGWSGRPVCLMQCASGANWPDKLHTPNINTWQKLVDFGTKPRRGLSMPFAPEATDFRLKTNDDHVMLLLDRHRLLTPRYVAKAAFPSAELDVDLQAWTSKRVAAFPNDRD